MKIQVTQDASINFQEKSNWSITDEFATRKRSFNYYTIGMYLPNPDPVLKKLGQDITVYKELSTDPHVTACIVSRKAGVQSMEWGIDRGKARSNQSKIIEKLFNKLNIHKITGELLEATLYGFQPMEILWEKDNDLILPCDLVGKPPDWFVFDEENQLRFRTKENYINGELLPERKFLCPQHQSSYENPYGTPSLSKVFWPITFKKGGLRFWSIFTEKYGMPFLIGKHPRGATKKDIENLADMLEDMIQDAIAVIPDGDSVELKESPFKTGSAGIYKELLNFCNDETSKAILGQTLTTQVGDKGSYAASQTHMEVRQDIVDSDKKLVEETFNQLINWIYEINFNQGERPVFSLWQEEDVDETLARRDKTLKETGVKFTKQYYVKAYGLEEEDFEIENTPAQGQPAPAEFAENEKQDAIPPEDLQRY